MRRPGWLVLAALLGAPGLARGQVGTATAAHGLPPPPYGRDDIPALEVALERSAAHFEATLERWNEIVRREIGTPEQRAAADDLIAAEERRSELEAAIARAKTAPLRAFVQLRARYDALRDDLQARQARLRVLPRAQAPATAPEAVDIEGQSLVLGELAEAIYRAERELAQILAAREALDEGPRPGSPLEERLSDLEKLDEELRREEERLAFAERLHTHLLETVFATYEVYEREVEDALGVYEKLVALWGEVKSTPAEQWPSRAAPPREVAARTIFATGDGEPGIRKLWQERGGLAGLSGPLYVRAHAGQLAEFRRQAAKHRRLRDLLVDETDRLQTLEAQIAPPAAPAAPAAAPPRAPVGGREGEYARLSARIDEAEARKEALEKDEAELEEELEAVDSELAELQGEVEGAARAIEEKEARLADREQTVELVFPTARGREVERSARIQNFVMRERLASRQALREAIDRAARRIEIRRDVLGRRLLSVRAEQAQLEDSDLPRLRERYYLSLVETFGVRGLRVLVVLLVAYGLLRLIKRGSGPFIERIVKNTLARQGVEAIRQQRVRTLMWVLVGAAKVLIYLLAFLFVVAQLDIDYGPLLVAAGGLSLAVGFGAQSLVKDFFAGFFILLEGQYSIGDVVDIEGKSGIVEDLNLRTTVLRSLSGEVHVIPNGEIKVTTNKTKSWSRALVDVAVAYEENVDEIIAILRKLGAELAEQEYWSERLRSVDVLGVESFGDSSVNIRVILETAPGEQWAVSREFHRRVKLTFDELGVEIPWPQRVLTQKADRTDPRASSRKRAVIQRFVGQAPPEEDHPAPSFEERDRADAIANKEAAIRARTDVEEESPPEPAPEEDASHR